MSGASSAPESALEELLGQLAGEFTERSRRGERPDVESYARRHPELADVLRQVLPALQVMGSADAEGGEEREAPEAADRVLGDYHILRPVGRGGMGVVYEARQISLKRRVALKVLPFAATLDPKRLQRFHNEATAAAQLHHTNIVPVYAVGAERGVHYYAMQFIEGQTLAAVIDELRRQVAPAAPEAVPDAGPGESQTTPYEPVSPEPAEAFVSTKSLAGISTERSTKSRQFFRSVAQLGVQAAEALDYAHATGVVHRDIKPANLLVDVRGNLWVTDFGLAHVQSEAGLTLTGDLVGTIRYMSPEQALAKRVPIDHRTDIYSLGVTLYELVTLRPAFTGADRQELLRQIAFDEPTAPRRLNSALPSELETILLKAMEKNPVERYGTAQELADDLRRFLDDRPILARRPSLLQRGVKWSRRQGPWLAVAVGVLLLAVAALATGAAALSYQVGETKDALKREAAATKEAKENDERARRNAAEAQRQRDMAFKSLTDALDLADGYRGLGDRLRDGGRFTDAEKAYLQLEGLMKRVAASIPPTADKQAAAHNFNQRYRIGLANYQNFLGTFYQGLGRFGEAEKYYRRSLEAWKAAAAEETLAGPGATPSRLGLSRAYRDLGTLLQVTGRLPEAEQVFRDMVALKEDLVKSLPALSLFRMWLAQDLLTRGLFFAETGRIKEAEADYRHGLQLLEKIPRDEIPGWRRLKRLWGEQLLSDLCWDTGRPEEAAQSFRRALLLLQEGAGENAPAYAYQSLAWFLATCPDPQFRDAARSVELARRATAAAVREEQSAPAFRAGAWASIFVWEDTLPLPDDLSARNAILATTLGAASYRVGDWPAAVAALTQADQLHHCGNSFNWFFLAMAHHRLGHEDEARKWYADAVRWMDKHKPQDRELRRFRTEAENLLGRRGPAAPQGKATPAERD